MRAEANHLPDYHRHTVKLATRDSTRRIVRMKKSVFVCAEQVNRASLRLGSFFSILNVEWIRCCSGATRRRPYKTADSRHRGEQKRTKVATERTQAHSLFVRLSLSFSLSFCLLERDWDNVPTFLLGIRPSRQITIHPVSSLAILNRFG